MTLSQRLNFPEVLALRVESFEVNLAFTNQTNSVPKEHAAFMRQRV